MWSRWNLSIDWKRTPPCGGHRYGSVLTTVTHSTSSQSQMAASTRMVLISSKVTRMTSLQPDSHVTLPGYVWSNSEQDCLPHSIHEETKEGNGRQGDEIPMRESSKTLEGSKGEMEDVLWIDICGFKELVLWFSKSWWSKHLATIPLLDPQTLTIQY